jgi:hypothetical protein
VGYSRSITEVPGTNSLRPRPSHVFVVGPERSGTTWIAEAISQGGDARYIHEPDNPGPRYLHKRHNPVGNPISEFGLFPVLAPEHGCRPESARVFTAYNRIWERAFAGSASRQPTFRSKVKSRLLSRRQSATPHYGNGQQSNSSGTNNDNLVVKSVLALFAVEYVVSLFDPTAVILVRREPLSVAASLIELSARGVNRGDYLRPLYNHRIIRERYIEPLGLPALPNHLTNAESCAWWASLVNIVVTSYASVHPKWILVDHGDLIRDPPNGFGAALGQLGWNYTDAVEEFLEASNRPGDGFVTNRITATANERWRRTLGPDEYTVRRIIEQFPPGYPC